MKKAVPPQEVGLSPAELLESDRAAFRQEQRAHCRHVRKTKELLRDREAKVAERELRVGQVARLVCGTAYWLAFVATLKALAVAFLLTGLARYGVAADTVAALLLIFLPAFRRPHWRAR